MSELGQIRTKFHLSFSLRHARIPLNDRFNERKRSTHLFLLITSKSTIKSLFNNVSIITMSKYSTPFLSNIQQGRSMQNEEPFTNAICMGFRLVHHDDDLDHRSFVSCMYLYYYSTVYSVPFPRSTKYCRLNS